MRALIGKKQEFPLSLGRYVNQKPYLQGKSLRQKLVEIKAYLKFFDDGNFTPTLSQPKLK